jgi:hypothetical protein
MLFYTGDQIKSNQMGEASGMNGRQKTCIQGWWGDMRERDHLEDLGADGKIMLKWIFKKWDGETLTGLIWLRIGTGGWCL